MKTIILISVFLASSFIGKSQVEVGKIEVGKFDVLPPTTQVIRAITPTTDQFTPSMRAIPVVVSHIQAAPAQAVSSSHVPPPIKKDDNHDGDAHEPGMGTLTLYKTCNCYNVKIWIDGEYVGSTHIIYSGQPKPNCSQNGTVTKVLLAGRHHIYALDQENDTWNFDVNIYEGECLVHGLTLQ